MLKFMVVLYRRPDLTQVEFFRHLKEMHAPLAKNLPGLKKYAQNHVAPDPKRKPPGWDAIVELYFDNWEAMEAAWQVRKALLPMPTCLPLPTSIALHGL